MCGLQFQLLFPLPCPRQGQSKGRVDFLCRVIFYVRVHAVVYGRFCRRVWQLRNKADKVLNITMRCLSVSVFVDISDHINYQTDSAQTKFEVRSYTNRSCPFARASSMDKALFNARSLWSNSRGCFCRFFFPLENFCLTRLLLSEKMLHRKFTDLTAIKV